MISSTGDGYLVVDVVVVDVVVCALRSLPGPFRD